MSSDGDATIGPTQDIPGYPGLTPIGLAFVLCFIGSFCNGLGAMLPFVLKNATNYKILSFMLALSAGMLGYLSFVELFAEAREFFENITDLPLLFTSLSFLSGGFLCVGLEYLSHFLVHKYGSGDEGVDLLVGNSSQDEENQNEKVEQRMEMQESTRSIQRDLKKVSWFSLITISVHNVPEGIAVFFSTLANPAFGILVAFAFAVHSLMEGVIVSMPFYYATNNKRKAMLYGALSGIAQPLGAVIGYAIYAGSIGEVTKEQLESNAVFAYMYAMIGGIMSMLAFAELLPAAHRFDKSNGTVSNIGLLTGFTVLALSLGLFEATGNGA